MTIKTNIGWNSWILGSALVQGSTMSGVSAGGLSFGADALLDNPNGLSYGVGVAYLPMFSATNSGENASIQMIPIVAELFFNGSAPFYTNWGLGIGLLQVTSNSGIFGSSTNSAFSPSPGLLGKVGLGWAFKINPLIAIDLGADTYLPFTDFGLGGGSDNAVLDLIVFSQFNLKLGVDFNF